MKEEHDILPFMGDDPIPKRDETAASAKGGILPVHMIPEDILQDWSALPNGSVINVPFTKQDLDNLFFAIANTQNAIDMTNRAFVQWSNGQLVEAQNNLEGSKHSIVAGVNCLRFLFESLVTGMVKGAQDG